MDDNNISTEYPTGVINWTNEEGARFPISMVSSGVWAGAFAIEKAYNLVEVGGGKATQKSELERIGYLGSMEASYKANPIGAHFELHIEQGPILESSGGKVGAVEGVQAYKWFTITVKGRDCQYVKFCPSFLSLSTGELFASCWIALKRLFTKKTSLSSSD